MKHTPVVKTTIVLIIAILVSMSLISCGYSDTIHFSTVTDNEHYIESDQQREISTEEPTEANSFDLLTEQFSEAHPFSEGYAWVKVGGDYIFDSMVIDGNGNILYRYDGVCGSEFQDGASLIEDPHNNSDNDIIIDPYGNILYTLSKTEECTEKCVIRGDGYFMLERTVKTFDDNGTYYIVIDKNGKELSEPVKKLGYEMNMNYLGHGIFYIYGDFFDVSSEYSKVLPKHENSSIRFKIYGHCSENGKVWVEVTRNGTPIGIALYDVFSAEYQLIEAKKWIVNGTDAFADGTYYDINGNAVFSVEKNADKVDKYSSISDDGYVALLLKGEDYNYYFSYVNTQGKEVVAPTKWTDGASMTENYYCIVDNGTVNVFKPDGTTVITISSDNVDYLAEDYIICRGRYYFF